MIKRSFYKIILLLTLLITQSTHANLSQNLIKDHYCSNNPEELNLYSAWSRWKPYQYEMITDYGTVLAGMDLEMLNLIMNKMSTNIEYKNIELNQHFNEVKNGNIHIAAGMTYTDERAKYVYFSLPYRYEENSLFALKQNPKNINFNTIDEYLAQARLYQFRIGVLKNFVYADHNINKFINDPLNSDIIFFYPNEQTALGALLQGTIDGFMADKLVASQIIVANNLMKQVKEITLNVKTPIHFVFNKNTVPSGLVQKFNEKIKETLPSEEYKQMVKNHLYTVLLMQTVGSKWFYILSLIGTIAFTISGLAIAAKDNTTLFTAILFALLPSIGGSIMRDVIIDNEEMTIFLNPSYMYYTLVIVILGFSTMRLFLYYQNGDEYLKKLTKIWDHCLTVSDAIGQSCFVVIGTSMAVIAHIKPVILWGPFFAFISANAGGIIRDLLRRKHHIICLDGSPNAEISVFWGVVFSLYIDSYSYDISMESIRKMVILMVIGSVIMRLAAFYLKVPNILFIQKSALKNNANKNSDK